MVSFPKRYQFHQRLHRAASRAITGCLSSSPIPLLFSEASLPPPLVALTHFALLSYERALRPPTSFPISGLARLCRSSWRAFASSHPPVLLLLGRLFLLASLSFLESAFVHRGVHPFLSMLSLRSSLSPAKVRLSPPLTLSSFMIWYPGQTALFLFLLARAVPAFLPTALCVALRSLFLFSRPGMFKFFR